MTTETLKPLRDVVVVKPLVKATTTTSGIVTSIKEPEAPTEGTVLAVGPKVDLIAVGDTVAFASNVIREDEFGMWMDSENVLGVVQKD